MNASGSRPPFVHLRVHSSHSALYGVTSIERLCEAAAARGFDAMALTDTNGLYGLPRFLCAARRTGLRPIVGVELAHGGHRVLALVKTRQGYADLCRVISARHCDPTFDLLPAIAARRGGLVLVSSDRAALTAWGRASREDLYVEVTPGRGMAAAIMLGRELGLPLLGTNHVVAADREELPLHPLLRAVALKTTRRGLEDGAHNGAAGALIDGQEADRCLAAAPDASSNTRLVAERCLAVSSLRDLLPAANAGIDPGADVVLRAKAYAGAASRYGGVPDAVARRLEEELDAIRARGFARYFLAVEALAGAASHTCGRGSAAASLVAYCVGLTHVDPIRHGLRFDRFLNPARSDPPDIDIDVPWDERDRLLDHALRAHGAERAAMVAAHVALGVQGAFREVARVYGLPPTEISRMSPLVARYGALVELSGERRADTLLAGLDRRFRLNPPALEILNAAVRIANAFRHIAVHCGGLVVADNLRARVPVEIAPKGVPVIQWDKDGVEDAGLVKIDLLGNRSLAVLRDARGASRSAGAGAVAAAVPSPDAPDGDEPARRLIQRGETIGCFHIESPATRLLLRKLWTRMPEARLAALDFFECLTTVSALVRPAAISYADEFVRRAHGAPGEPPHPSLASVLAHSHGVLVYQEDATRVAAILAGFSLEEGDELRRAVSRKATRREVREFAARFARGARSRGVAPATAEAVWQMLLGFTGYSFCKPHAASYAHLALQCAWLRAHRPAEFMAAVLSNEGGYYPPGAYVSEARRMGLTLCPPDINRSAWRYTGENGEIRMGLMSIKGLSPRVGDRIVAERRGRGPFATFRDFLVRVRPDPDACGRLIKAGAFDELGGALTRPALLWRLRAWSASRDAAAMPVPPEYDEPTRLRHELESFGFPVSRHPLDLYRDRLAGVTLVPASDLARHTGRRVRMAGWVVADKVTHSHGGAPMAFLTLEDQSALYDAVLFPDVYAREAERIFVNAACVVEGIADEDRGAVTLRLQRIRPLPPPRLEAEGDVREAAV